MPMPRATERHAVLLTNRNRKMARSAHAYVRGNTARFHEWLGASPAARRVPEGPMVWICGDCHLGNLGPIADGRGAIDAPGWLWESVVSLAGRHESGYLDHCRQYALAA